MTPAHSSPHPDKSHSLTQAFKCDSAHLEITSKCNLACVYCAVSQPTYNGVSLPQKQASNIVDWLLQHKVTNINLNGHGETTIVQGWEKIVEPLLQSKSQCHIITNASKSYSEAELDALCRLKTITISCDTLDPDLHARLRRKSQLRDVLRTISQIRLAATQRGLKPPLIILSCVLGAENSEHLEEFILTAQCMNIHAIQLCSLTEYPIPKDATFNLSPLSKLPKEQLQKLKNLLTSYNKSADGSGMEFVSIQSRIFTEINAGLTEPTAILPLS